MDMKLSNKTLFSASEVISELSNIKDIPVRLSFNISKNIRAIKNALELFENMRKKLVTDNAIKDANGEVIQENGNVRITNIMKFNQQMEELFDIENSIDITVIKISDLEACSAKVQPAVLVNAAFMFEG
jgi:hypothetical protein